MNKKLKIILGTILILIVSGIGGFYLLSYLGFTAWINSSEDEQALGQYFVVQEGKEAQSTFESVTKISNAPISETRTYVVNWLDPAFFSRFRSNKDFIKELIAKYKLEEQSIESSDCKTLLNVSTGQPWWNPQKFTVDKCYLGSTEKEKHYLMYHPKSGNTFLFIQR